MQIKLTITDPTGDFQDRLLALLAEHAGHIEPDATWTPDRAERYIAELPPRARRILREVVVRNGYVRADDLRDDENTSLRGHSAALKRILEKGVRKGWWPDRMPEPIEAHGPGFGKVLGYRMPGDLVGIFMTAIENAGMGPRIVVGG
ncbi:hypothetical protein QZN11_34425 [Streptomyces gramineus]|uniref:hypothetical protein n=1 Tax=Streptomyces gramineus TaxID=910542 RepID=UPI00398B871B